jgi:hypothetical protein
MGHGCMGSIWIRLLLLILSRGAYRYAYWGRPMAELNPSTTSATPLNLLRCLLLHYHETLVSLDQRISPISKLKYAIVPGMAHWSPTWRAHKSLRPPIRNSSPCVAARKGEAVAVCMSSLVPTSRIRACIPATYTLPSCLFLSC